METPRQAKRVFGGIKRVASVVGAFPQFRSRSEKNIRQLLGFRSMKTGGGPVSPGQKELRHKLRKDREFGGRELLILLDKQVPRRTIGGTSGMSFQAETDNG